MIFSLEKFRSKIILLFSIYLFSTISKTFTSSKKNFLFFIFPFFAIINSDLDPSLTDNAAGYSNYTAPGADRLSISIQLTKIPYIDPKPSNFIELMEVREGRITSNRRNTEYDEISQEFARRNKFENSITGIRNFRKAVFKEKVR